LTTKYAIIIPDGAADDPIDLFEGKTVIEAADIPNIDNISTNGKQGIVRTVPPDMTPGSDVAQMSLLGYDPKQYYTGRAPLEAAAKDITLAPDDWVFRCNLVTIADNLMADHSAGHISNEEASNLINEFAAALSDDRLRFYNGISYRHLCVISGVQFKVHTQPLLCDIIARSQQLFEDHQINRVRRDLGENPVSSVWLWGQGQKAYLESFHKRFGIKGVAITAVDLVKGLAKLIGFDIIDVPGATGFVDTNYVGKGHAAVDALEKYDLVFVHIEAPDEAGHSGNAQLKKKTLEQIDKYIVGPVHQAIKKYENYRVLVMPDHPTPVATRAHSGDAVPFAMDGTGINGILQKPFSEANAHDSGFRVEKGSEMMEYFLKI